MPLTCEATLRRARLLGGPEPPSHPTNAAAGPAVQLAAGRARGGEKLTGDVAGGDQYGLGTPQRPVGWQPPGVAPPVTSLEGTAKGKVGPGSETRMPKPGLVHTSRG